MPCSLIDSASRANGSSSNRVRGCIEPGSIKAISISSESCALLTVSSEPSSAPRPRPSAFRFIHDLPGNYFPGQLGIGLRPFGIWVVAYDWFTVTGCLSESDIPRYDALKHLLTVEVAQIGGHCR